MNNVDEAHELTDPAINRVDCAAGLLTAQLMAAGEAGEQSHSIVDVAGKLVAGADESEQHIVVPDVMENALGLVGQVFDSRSAG